jgi:hypothetical protein
VISNRAPVPSGVALADLLHVLDTAKALRARWNIAGCCDIWVDGREYVWRIEHSTANPQEGSFMNPVKVIAIVLIVGGMLGLVYGGFSYTKDSTVVKLGPLEVSAKEKQTVNVPMWVGVGAIVVGGLLLVFGAKR